MADTTNNSQKSTTAPPTPARPIIAINRAAIASQAQQTLNLLHGRLSDIEARVTTSVNAFLALAQSKQAQTLAQNSPDLADSKDDLPTLVNSLQKLATATQANQKARIQGISTLLTNLQTVAQGKL